MGATNLIVLLAAGVGVVAAVVVVVANRWSSLVRVTLASASIVVVVVCIVDGVGVGVAPQQQVAMSNDAMHMISGRHRLCNKEPRLLTN